MQQGFEGGESGVCEAAVAVKDGGEGVIRRKMGGGGGVESPRGKRRGNEIWNDGVGSEERHLLLHLGCCFFP